MNKRKIVVEDYSEEWALTFQQLKSVYELHLGNLLCDIHHVGSTSVYGLAAKPVIDIDLVIDDRNKFSPVFEKLISLGYEHLGNLGVTDRDAFIGKTKLAPFDGSQHSWQRHNLYVCPSDSISLKNHLALREFLRSHPEKVKQYGALKKKLAAEYPYNIDLYVEHKTPFITAILKESGFDSNTLDKIKQENKVEKS